jgi:hypothetical protein
MVASHGPWTGLQTFDKQSRQPIPSQSSCLHLPTTKDRNVSVFAAHLAKLNGCKGSGVSFRDLRKLTLVET